MVKSLKEYSLVTVETTIIGDTLIWIQFYTAFYWSTKDQKHNG